MALADRGQRGDRPSPPAHGSTGSGVGGRPRGGRPAARRRNRAPRARRPAPGGAGRAAGALPGGGRAVRRRGLLTCGDRGDPGVGAGHRAIGRVSRPPQAAGAVGRLEGGPVRQEPLWSPDHADPALGEALRAALTPRDDTAEFVTGYLVGRGRDVATSFDAVWVTSATGSEAAAELLATHRAPDPSALFAAMFAN